MQVLDVVVMPAGASEMRGNADGKRSQPTVARCSRSRSDARSVLPWRQSDHLDVVAFPVHLLATGIVAGGSGDHISIGDGWPEGRVGVRPQGAAPR